MQRFAWTSRPPSQRLPAATSLVTHQTSLPLSTHCAGKSAALVGESGSGKSTIIQLLLRLYEPSAGAVLLDGRDVRSLPLVRWCVGEGVIL